MKRHQLILISLLIISTLFSCNQTPEANSQEALEINDSTTPEIIEDNPPSEITSGEEFSEAHLMFVGAWFEVQYPESFSVAPSLESTSASGYESVIFSSKDNKVQFYVFSPQWSGEATDIELDKSTEKLASEESQISSDGNTKLTFTSITANNGSYTRSYQEIENSLYGTNHIFGIKYANQASYDRYIDEYQRFKESLIQYAD